MKRYVFAFIILLFIVCRAGSQTRTIDSLHNLVNAVNHDSAKVNALNDLCIEYISNSYYDSAFQYTLISKELAEKIDFKRGLALSYNILANIYFYQGNYSECLKYNLKALKIKEQLADKRGIANSYNNIGNAYYKLNNGKEALKNHFAALKIREELNDQANIAYSYNNIGNVFQSQGDYSSALEYHLRSLNIKKELNSKEEMPTSLTNVGIVLAYMKNYSEALKYYFESIKISEELNDQEGLEITYTNLSSAYFKLKDYQKAEEYGQMALKLATEIGDVETIIDANMELSDIYKEKREFEKALKYYSAYIYFKDSLFNEESIKKAVETQLESEFEKTITAEKLEHEKIEAISKIENRKQRIILILVSGVLVLVIIFALFIYRIYSQKQEANKIIVQQKMEVERQNKTIEQKNKDITSSITYAQRIQQAILPSLDSIKEKFPDSFVFYRPKDIIAGDFYWVSDAVTTYQEKFVMFAVADCTGHGVPGALLSIIGNNFLRMCEREPSVNRPSEALDFINLGISRTLRQESSKNVVQDGMDIVFIAIDYEASVLHFSGAKNSIYLIREGNLTEYKGDRHPIGTLLGEEMKKFTNHSIPLEKGDCIYLFSDGYADQFGGTEGKKFMYSRFKKLLETNSHLPMENQQEIVVKTFNEWIGNHEQIDDVCVVGIRV